MGKTTGVFPISGPSILNGKDRGNGSIRRAFLNDFHNNAPKNSYFRGDYDEPTYLTFRIAFTFDNPSSENSYNDMPMPLLAPPTSKAKADPEMFSVIEAANTPLTDRMN